MIKDQPRRINETPTARQTNHESNHGRVVQNTAPSRSMTAPSTTAHGQLRNLRRSAASKRKRPTTVKRQANSSVQPTSPAAGCERESNTIEMPATPGTRGKKYEC